MTTPRRPLDPVDNDADKIKRSGKDHHNNKGARHFHVMEKKRQKRSPIDHDIVSKNRDVKHHDDDEDDNHKSHKDKKEKASKNRNVIGGNDTKNKSINDKNKKESQNGNTGGDKSKDNSTPGSELTMFMRAKTIIFKAEGLKPNTRYYPFFDDVYVGTHCSTVNGQQESPILTDTAGNIVGNFYLQAGTFLTGNHAFKLVDSIVVNSDGSTMPANGYSSIEADYQATAVLKNLSTNITTETLDVKETTEPPKVVIDASAPATATNASNPTPKPTQTDHLIDTSVVVPCPPAPKPPMVIKYTCQMTRFGIAGVAQSFYTDVQTKILPATDPPPERLKRIPISINQLTGVSQFGRDFTEWTASAPYIDPNWKAPEAKYCDPLAQSFLVDSTTYPYGMFATAISVYFKKIDQSSPVTLELRNMENGVPGSTILPSGQVTLPGTAISSSTDASVATLFSFDQPVFLQPNTEYCFVLKSPSVGYEAWVSKFGDYDISKGQVVTTLDTLVTSTDTTYETTTEYVTVTTDTATTSVVTTPGTPAVYKTEEKTQAFALPGQTSFTIPDGVTKIQVSATGAGGGGGGAGHGSGGETGGSGGGGGSGYTTTGTITVTPGEVLTVTVGAGGAGGLRHHSRYSTPLPEWYGQNGEATTIKRGSDILIKANPGNGGKPGHEFGSGGGISPAGGTGRQPGQTGGYTGRTDSGILDITDPSTYNINYDVIVDNYSTWAPLANPALVGGTVAVFGYETGADLGYDSIEGDLKKYNRTFTSIDKINLSSTGSIGWKINRAGTWGDAPEQVHNDFIRLQYSVDGTTWSTMDEVKPNTLTANTWATKTTNLPTAAKVAGGVYLRFLNSGGFSTTQVSPRDTYAISFATIGTFVGGPALVLGGNGGASTLAAGGISTALTPDLDRVSSDKPGTRGSGGAGGACKDSPDNGYIGGRGGDGYVSLSYEQQVLVTPATEATTSTVTTTTPITSTTAVTTTTPVTTTQSNIVTTRVTSPGPLITEQPYGGVLFKSSNDYSWIPEQLEDLKFDLYKAEFDTSVNSNMVFKPQKRVLAATDLVQGRTYVIASVGTTPTNWTSIGSASATVGTSFVKNSTTATGTGTAYDLYFSTSKNILLSSISTTSGSGVLNITIPMHGLINQVGLKDKIVIANMPLNNTINGILLSSLNGEWEATVVDEDNVTITTTQTATITGSMITSDFLHPINTNPPVAGRSKVYASTTIEANVGTKSPSTIPVAPTRLVAPTPPTELGNYSFTVYTNLLINEAMVDYLGTEMAGTGIAEFINIANGQSTSGSEEPYEASTYLEVDRDGIFTEFAEPRLLATPVNEYLHKTTLNNDVSAKVKINLISLDKNISPVVDINGMNLMVKTYFIDNQGNELAACVTEADFNNESLNSEIGSGTGNANAKYKTQVVQNKDSTKQIKIFVNANCPSPAKIDCYIRTSNDPSTHIDRSWTWVNLNGGFGTVFKNSPNNKVINEYFFNHTSAESFNTFDLKFVMRSTNNSVVPKIFSIRTMTSIDNV